MLLAVAALLLLMWMGERRGKAKAEAALRWRRGVKRAARSERAPRIREEMPEDVGAAGRLVEAWRLESSAG